MGQGKKKFQIQYLGIANQILLILYNYNITIILFE